MRTDAVQGRRLLSALIGASLLLAHPVRAQAQPAVTIGSGALAGTEKNGVLAFLGIPYAERPVGALRWRAPQAPAAWHGQRDASQFGAACPQPDDRFSGLTPKVQDEACLYLNVWAPRSNGQRLPVMVWLHGGAHRIGAGSLPFYDGEKLARRGVVVVTFNYRLGYLGYFSHPSLDAAHDGGNFGLMDQRFAVEWVRRNIEAFGGDPQQITVFGESAGGADILYLMADPESQGLFARAIVQSGGGWGRPWAKAKMQKSVLGNLEKGGIAKTVTVADLRGLDARKLVDVQDSVMGFGPFLDEKVTFEAPAKAFEEGRAARVPLIIGSNDWEANLLLARTRKDMIARLLPYLPQAYRWYGDRTDDAEGREALMFRDVVFAAPARWLAARHSKFAPTWLFTFSYVTSGNRGKVPGAGHGAEIPYVFDNVGATPKSAASSAAEDHALAARVSDCWAAFARTGSPKCSLEPWQPYDVKADNEMLIDSAPRQVKHPDGETLNGVEGLFGPGKLLGR